MTVILMLWKRVEEWERRLNRYVGEEEDWRMEERGS